METSDNALVQSCQQGQSDDFGRLYEKYIKKIYNFIYYRTLHQETAEDLTSTTFIKALENIKRYQAQNGSFSSWLYQIARNNVIDHYRSQKKDINIDEVLNLGYRINIEKDIDTKERLEKIAEYLGHLDQEQREVILMRVWDGLSYKEIAEITQKSQASLKMMFSRAARKLKKENALGLFILLLLIN